MQGTRIAHQSPLESTPMIRKNAENYIWEELGWDGSVWTMRRGTKGRSQRKSLSSESYRRGRWPSNRNTRLIWVDSGCPNSLNFRTFNIQAQVSPDPEDRLLSHVVKWFHSFSSRHPTFFTFIFHSSSNCRCQIDQLRYVVQTVRVTMERHTTSVLISLDRPERSVMLPVPCYTQHERYIDTWSAWIRLTSLRGGCKYKISHTHRCEAQHIYLWVAARQDISGTVCRTC